MEQMILSYGIPGIGFALLYWVLSSNKERDKLQRQEDILLRKEQTQAINNMVEAIHEVITKDTQLIVSLRDTQAETMRQYNRIIELSVKSIELVNNIDLRTQLCVKQQEHKQSKQYIAKESDD